MPVNIYRVLILPLHVAVMPGVLNDCTSDNFVLKIIYVLFFLNFIERYRHENLGEYARSSFLSATLLRCR